MSVNHLVLKAIHDIAALIQEGDSIQLARKKVCGADNKSFTREVKKHEKYHSLLNYYLKDRGYGVRFVKRNGHLAPEKNSRGT